MNNLSITKDASVIIVTYNHSKYIENCIRSVLLNNPLEVIVVDNGSTDGTLEILRNFDEIKVIEGHGNVGYGAGNNLGVEASKGKYSVILNPDTVVSEKWLEELLRPLKSQKKLVTTPKVLLFDGNKINGAGLTVHFTGLSFLRGLNASVDEYANEEFVNGITGACFAMRRNDYLKLKFDENILTYNEDGELSWRLNLAGFRILYVPNSIIYHDYVLKVPPEKIYHLEKGRYIILRKYFNLKQILLILPSLIIAEILTWGYAFLQGFEGLKFKIKAISDSFKVDITPLRNDTRTLIQNLDPKIPEDQLTYSAFDKFVKRFSNLVFLINYRILIRR